MKKLFLILLLAATAAQAETYKWTDKEGTVHFSESIGEVPANYRQSAEQIGIDTGDATTGNRAASPAEPRQSADDKASVEGLKERMLKDEGIMTLIRAMQEDPEMQAILRDPATVSAVQSGDIGALMNNPAFLKLLDSPWVREIEKKLQNGGTR